MLRKLLVPALLALGAAPLQAQSVRTLGVTPLAPDAAPVPNDRYGWSLVVEGDRALVGATYVNEFRGRVYAFERSGPGAPWQEVDSFGRPDNLNGAYFGSDMALEGDTLVVSSPYAQPRVFVFERNLGDPVSWDQVAELQGVVGVGGLGNSVALSGDVVVAGSPQVFPDGEVYVYERDAFGQWSFAQTLLPTPDPANDRFGECVAADGDTLVVARELRSGTLRSTNVDVYERGAGGGWSLATSLPAFDDRTNGARRIDARGGRIAAVGPRGGQSVLVFYERDAGTPGGWREAAALPVPDCALTLSGESVALAGDRALVGCPGASGGTGAGWLFERFAVGAPRWRATARFQATASSGEFARSVALSADTALLGDWKLGPGAAYVAPLPRSPFRAIRPTATR